MLILRSLYHEALIPLRPIITKGYSAIGNYICLSQWLKRWSMSTQTDKYTLIYRRDKQMDFSIFCGGLSLSPKTK